MGPDEQTLPRNVVWEKARIQNFPAVVGNSVTYRENCDGSATLAFSIRTDKWLDDNSVSQIHDIEPIDFTYPSRDLIGQRAPLVLSGRADFPRDLQHLNPTDEGDPASICLARTGLQAIYDRIGVRGALIRLGEWLADAKVEQLYADGWDPVPMASMKDCVLGYIDAQSLQNHAIARPLGGYGYISAMLTHSESGGPFVQAGTPLLETEDILSLNVAKLQMQACNPSGQPFHTAVPAIFVWPPRTCVESIPHFNRWRDINSLRQGLENTGLWSRAEEATLKFDPLFSNDPFGGAVPDRDMNGKRAFVVIVGLWRPAPLDSTIVGLAEDTKARSLELRAYYLERGLHESDRWAPTSMVRDFFGLTPATPEVLESVSGEAAIGTPLVIGGGALGSAFLDYAVRGGADSIRVIENDHLLAHNLARHRGDRAHVPKHKIAVAKDLTQARAQDVAFFGLQANILDLPSAALCSEIEAAKIVADLTAEPQVRSLLSRRDLPKRPIIRSEVFQQGKLGVSMLTYTADPHSLNCLYHQLVALAQTEPIVKAWLGYEASRHYQDEELLLGFGCRSLTTKLPAYKVDAHAATAFAIAKSRLQNLERALIGLSAIDEAGIPVGCKIIEPEPVHLFEGESGLGDWRVVIVVSALEKMRTSKTTAAPNETGGYLYGVINESISEICVLYASAEPPSTIATPGHVQLGPCGWTGEEQAFTRRTFNRLPPIGTWHSHPVGTPTASATDWRTVEGFTNADAKRGLPTVMAIVGQTSERLYVVEP